MGGVYNGTTFTGISCVTAAACVAVGFATHQPPIGQPDVPTTVAEHWDGVRWSLDRTPDVTGAAESVLTAVSCPSAGDCVAVGFSQTPTTELPLAERLRHGVWQTLSVPAVGGGALWAQLAGVSCPTAQTCTAVGSWTDSSSNNHSIALRLHGDRWRVQSTPTIPATTSDSLAAVSCPTREVCTAVGNQYENLPELGATQEPLAERWVAPGDRRHHGGRS